MRVLLLGAGASKCAGYPLANELIPAIKREAEITCLDNLKSAWRTWEEFVRAQRGALALILNNSNPEIVLSAVDLCEMGRTARDCFKPEYADKGLVREWELVPKRQWRSAGHKALFQAGDARNRFVDCLNWFFTFKHEDDCQIDKRDQRAYLRELLCELHEGDVVITLNWDTTIERSSGELGRWNPITGYGFEKNLRLGTKKSSRPLSRKLRNRKSEVLVLKLHGSYGWYQMPGGKVYFNNDHFLPRFNPLYNDSPFFDPDAPSIGPDRSPVLAYPSFLKQLGGIELRRYGTEPPQR